MEHAHEHAHSVANVPQALLAATQWCATRGERLTDLRRDVLALLLAAPGSVKAYDLLGALQKQRPNAAPPTVYRALDFLLSMGLVHKLDSINAFVACRDFSVQHHGLMLICEGCGGVTELVDDRLSHALTSDAAHAGFRVREQDIELRGLCADCSVEAPPAPEEKP